ncbi:unnamed protein product [Ilex paraguariensis]|uniref:K Homology domain-containing protein n=1 Tax=Ilex paraguariensis TaxID=185542 RepID=A0ABC8S371_9AQUA
MEGNRRPFFKKLANPQFKKKGGNKKGKWHNSSHELSFGSSQASDTVYRILCQSRKIGSVIGKGGNIVKALREETQAKITVADSVPGADERVIIIYSPPTKISRKHDTDNSDGDPATDKEDELMEPHCPAQDALLKVHDRIMEEDLLGGMENEDDNENVVTARLLVPNNMVGCLLGKKGDVIQRLRSETGASIRVLPAEHLPTCAMETDELVQISGKPAVAKQALYEVSTLLHQNPRKDKPPLNFPMVHGGQSFHPPAPPMGNMQPPGNPMWSQRNNNPHGMPPVPWMGRYGNQPSGFGLGDFNDSPAAHGGEAPSEFSLKILCSAAKIGGVIGKGGFNVKQLQQETGASIHVEDVSAESDDRIIRVSSFEALWNPRSQTIDAVLELQNKTSEPSDKGGITTRLLVPSSKVGCLLGQGGHVINEMRRRTRADIRVYSKEDKPKCASEDEELVQISGNFGVAKDALAEVASRLRTRFLRDANAGAEPGPVGPVPRFPRFGHSGNLSGAGPPPPAGSGGYEMLKVYLTKALYIRVRRQASEVNRHAFTEWDCWRVQVLSDSYRHSSLGEVGCGNFGRGGRREYEPPSYQVPPSAAGFQNVNSSMEFRIPNNPVNSGMGTGSNNIGDITGSRMKLQEYHSGGSASAVDIRGSAEHLNANHSMLQAYNSSGGQYHNTQQGSYQNYDAQQAAYPNINAPQTPYQINAQHAPYQNTQQASYQNMSAQGPYQY